jgi:Domain of unknown function (DUF1707)
MNTYRLMRACDSDREAVLELLRDGYAVGRLTREEFDERSTAAYSAKTYGELDDLTADLPLRPAAPLDREVAASRRSPRNVGQMVRAFVLVLTAGLAGRVFPAAAWAALILVCLVFALPFAWRRN